MYAGWRGTVNPPAVVDSLDYAFHDDARRFETGLLDYPAVYTLHAALDFLNHVGMPYISARVLALSGQVRRWPGTAGHYAVDAARPGAARRYRVV